ncbi:MOSC domain-containing protein [Salicola sp. Rm-C-2C1-2]|uniref:MOSC domain-containing protein n=1 Tax=Salicola sp. Rm-C-2C1-2 TaxID=3141321 RepID=UPI0032E3D7FD
MSNSESLATLLDTLPQVGEVCWLGIRPARGESMEKLERVRVFQGSGLEGDRYNGRATSRRQVTLIQQEHLPVIASCAGHKSVEAAAVRRNILVSGINLLALKGKTFRVGEALLEYTGPCDPCSKMEALLGPGGYNAMRGHGGITARVLEEGEIAIGDSVWQGAGHGLAP